MRRCSSIIYFLTNGVNPRLDASIKQGLISIQPSVEQRGDMPVKQALYALHLVGKDCTLSTCMMPKNTLQIPNFYVTDEK